MSVETKTAGPPRTQPDGPVTPKGPRRRMPLARMLPYALLAVAILAAPATVCKPSDTGSNYYLTVLIVIGIHTILAVGLNLLMGYAGQVSLGHAAFYGLGAYTSAILTTRHGLSPWVALLVGILLSSVIAWLLGRQALRLHGHYLAMATLGFGMIVSIVLLQWEPMTGGTSGIPGNPRLQIAGHAIDRAIRMYYLVWALVTAVIALSANIVDSRVGRAFRAVHGSEVAAATLGVDAARYKLQVFVLSAALASVAGSLYAHYVTFISPEPFGFKFSVELVVMVVVGGMASIWGAIFGAGAITMLSEVLRSVGTAKIGSLEVPLADFDVVAFGLILMVVMVYLPEGLTRAVVDGARLLTRRRGKGAR